jgi:hypothetical protein
MTERETVAEGGTNSTAFDDLHHTTTTDVPSPSKPNCKTSLKNTSSSSFFFQSAYYFIKLLYQFTPS